MRTAREVLDQVEREFGRARGHVSSTDGLMAIAVYELAKAVKNDPESSVLAEVNKKVRVAQEALKTLHLAMHAVDDAINATR